MEIDLGEMLAIDAAVRILRRGGAGDAG